MKSQQVSLTSSKAKRLEMKVIWIGVTTWTQAAGQARNLKSKTIEIGCSNKRVMFHTASRVKLLSHEMQQILTLVYVCICYYICQTIFLPFCECQQNSYWMFIEKSLMDITWKFLTKSIDLELCNNMNTQRLADYLIK